MSANPVDTNITVTINGAPESSLLLEGPDLHGAPRKGNEMPTYNTINGTEGRDVIAGTSSDDFIRAEGGRDIVNAGAGNDNVRGDQGADTLRGDEGDDILAGQGQDDRLVGDAGDDTLAGGGGNDKLFAGDGDDVIVGGAGNDDLYGDVHTIKNNGASGADTFVFDSNDGNDRVHDFSTLADFIVLTEDVAYSVAQVGSKAVLTYGSTTVTFTGVNADDLAARITVDSDYDLSFA